MTVVAADWEGLRGAIAGDVVVPGSPAYEQARRPAIARFHDTRPQAVVRCRTATDVAETIAFARRSGLQVAVRSGGHCFAGRSSTDGVVIDVRPLRSISLSNGVVSIGAGARLGEVYDALHAHRLTIAAGCGPEVGIAGLALGGGLGLLGRKHGLVSDNLVRATVVLADASVVECDEQRDADLFWALRGAGGGMFGVVTSLVFRSIQEPTATSLHLQWRYADAADVLDAWQTWSPDGPDELAASLLVKVPADVSLEPTVNVFGSLIGTAAQANELLDELSVKPVSRTVEQQSYRDVKRHLVSLGETLDPAPIEDGHMLIKSEYFDRSVPVEALIENAVTDRVPGQARELDLSPWGGAYNQVPADATAFVHRNERFLLKHMVVVAGAPEEYPAAREWLDRSWNSVHHYGTGRSYQNFPDPELADAGRAYYGSNFERLVSVKAAYDPENVFHFHQSVPTQL